MKNISLFSRCYLKFNDKKYLKISNTVYLKSFFESSNEWIGERHVIIEQIRLRPYNPTFLECKLMWKCFFLIPSILTYNNVTDRLLMMSRNGLSNPTNRCTY